MSTAEAVQTIRSVIKGCLSPNDAERKPAEEFLRGHESHPGFTSAMLEVAVMPECDAGTRQLAIIYFKNNCGRYWRGIYAQRISDDEKHAVRDRLLQVFFTMDESSAVHAGIALSSVFRGDTPEANAELLQKLLAPLSQLSNVADPTVLQQAHRVLTGLKPIMKLWSTMPSYYWKKREKFELLNQAIPGLIGMLHPIWKNACDNHGVAGPQQEGTIVVLRMAIVTVRDTLRGAPEGCQEVAPIARQAFQTLEACAISHQSIPQGKARAIHSKTIQSVGKLLSILQEKHPRSFVGANGEELPQYLNFCTSVLGDPSKECIRGPCMAFLAAVLECQMYRQNTGAVIKDNMSLQRARERRSEEEVAFAVAAEGLLVQFFTAGRVADIVRFVTTTYLVLTGDDLSDWQEDPEAFVLGTAPPKSQPQDAEGEAERQRSFKETAVAEQLVKAVIVAQSDDAVKAIMELFQSAINSGGQGLLLKDACLTAMGLALGDRCFAKSVDLSPWFEQVLGPELNVSSADQVVLHRRILWLVGQAAAGLKPDLKAAFCKMILQLLQHSTTDMVVRLTAASTMAVILETTAEEARAHNFTVSLQSLNKDAGTDVLEDPFGQATADTAGVLHTVMQLFNQVESVAVRQEILRAIPAMMKVHVMRMRDAKRKNLPVPVWGGTQSVMEALPIIAQAVGGEMMLQAAMLDIAQQLMLVTQSHEANLQVAGPLIVKNFTNPLVLRTEGMSVRESTLMMWRSMLQMAPSINMIGSLYQYAQQLLTLTPDVCSSKEYPQVIHLCTDYMLLGQRDFVIANGEAYVSALLQIMQREESPDIYQRLSLARAINVLLVTVPSEAASLLMPLYLAALFKQDSTGAAVSSPYWDQMSFRNELCYHWIRLGYINSEHFMQVMNHLGQQAPPALAEQISTAKLLTQFLTIVGRCQNCGIRLQAIVVLSNLLLRAPSEPVLQSCIGQLFAACVHLLSQAVEPSQLKRTLWLESSFFPKDEAERKGLLCSVDDQANAIPGQVMQRIQEFAQAIGEQAMQGVLAAGNNAKTGEQLKKLGAIFASGGAAAGFGASPVSPLPTPTVPPPTAGSFTL